MKPIQYFGLAIAVYGVYRMTQPTPQLAGIVDPTYTRNNWIIVVIGVLLALFGDKEL